MKHVGGLDEEGEIRGPWRHSGVQGLWYMMGNLALSRFHSNHIALRMFFFQILVAVKSVDLVWYRN
jgi:hypothetical protein